MAKGVNVGLYLSGQPVRINECNIAITQPKIKDIVVFGEDEFLIALNIFGHPENITNPMKKGNSELEMFNDFQLLLVIMNQEPLIKSNILNFLNLICPNYEINITDSSIEFKIEQDNGNKIVAGMLNPFNFDKFKEVVNDLFEATADSEREPNYNPANEAAAAIAEKIKKGRERKNRMNADKEGPQSLFGRYVSILSIGLQMDISIFYNYTPFQLYDAFNRYFAKVNSDFYNRVSTMPFMDVSKTEQPPDWARNLYK